MYSLNTLVVFMYGCLFVADNYEFPCEKIMLYVWCWRNVVLIIKIENKSLVKVFAELPFTAI